VQLTQPSAQAVATFAASVERLTSGKGSLLLAISGGPDSLAMLLLANAALPGRCDAATIDHGLRPEAADEAEFVAALCRNLGMRHQILRPEKPIVGSLQAEARASRYTLLTAHAAQKGCDWIATAHHAEDQQETVLMRVARGSGVDGLAAIRERHKQIIRPMLAFQKAEMLTICAECNITPMQDPSNEDNHFDRVAMRQWLNAGGHPFDVRRTARTARACADASEALNWSTAELFAARVRHVDGGYLFDPDNIPRELLRRILLRIFDAIQPGYLPRGEAMDEAMSGLEKGEQRMLGNILCKGGAAWCFTVAPERQH
jgi:tRNA(Ile)-lysidine synthase